jgi:hypothetical protein
MYITDSKPPVTRNDQPGKHDSIRVHWTHADFAKIIRGEIGQQIGRMAITRELYVNDQVNLAETIPVCASRKIKESVRKTVNQLFNRDICLEELEFQPSDELSDKLAEVDV